VIAFEQHLATIVANARIPTEEELVGDGRSGFSSEWVILTDGAGGVVDLKPEPGTVQHAANQALPDDTVLIAGGTYDTPNHPTRLYYNDVWSTDDGKNWKLETEHADWPRRTHAQGIVFNNKIWILGGGRWLPEMIPHNDVWCSDDGANWQLVTDNAGWDPRIWFDAAVYRDRLWVMGGWSKEHGNFGDVWVSKNGADWPERKSDTIWSPPHEPFGVVFNDSLMMIGGHANPLTSEVWQLKLPAGWDGK